MSNSRLNLARRTLEPGADRAPEKVALIRVAGDGQISRHTYSELWTVVCGIAGALNDSVPADGRPLVLRLPHGLDALLIEMAGFAAGHIVAFPSPQLTPGDFQRILDDAGPGCVVYDSSLALPSLPPGATVLRAADLIGAAAHAVPFVADTSESDPALLLYTSGTSGVPRGALHGHRTLLGRIPMRDGWTGIDAGDVVLHTGMLNWSYTIGVGFLDPWLYGGTAVMYEGPRDPAVWPRVISEIGATVFASVPVLFRQILRRHLGGELRATRLRHALTAGEALSVELLRDWREATGTDLFEGLGMTECSTYVSSGPATPIRPGSPGRPQPGRTVVAISSDPAQGDAPLPPGEVGLLAVHRSDPGIMLRYWRDAGGEARVFRGDWFIGGDVVHLDADGYVWFHGRADDLMNAFGFRVSPLEIEKAIEAHPAVAEAGVCERRLSEEVRVIAAFVVLRPGARSSEAELLEWVTSRLTPWKRPREVHLVEALPRSAAGKLLRRELVESIATPRGVAEGGSS